MPAGGMPVWALDTPPGKRFFRVDCRLPPRVATGGFFIRKKPPVILLSARIKLLIIVRPDLEPCLRLFADRADLGRLGALMNMPAVETDPGRLLGLFEHGLPFDVGKEGIIPFSLAAASLRFSGVAGISLLWRIRNQISACSFSLFAVSSKMLPICS